MMPVCRFSNAGEKTTLTECQLARRTLLLLRSVAIKLEDGTPIAWALLGKCDRVKAREDIENRPL